MSLPANTPDLLRKAGLTVIEVGPWKGHGRPGSFGPAGQLNHHTGASAKSWTIAKRTEYARWMFYTGRSDLPAPLCQIAIGPGGEVYIGASGRANHAGRANPSGSMSGGDGNAIYYGYEWMLSGTESIPAEMMQAAITLNAVIGEYVTKTSVQTISCHYNTSQTGKWDIGDPNGVNYRGARVLDVPKFRSAVASRRSELREGGGKPAPSSVILKPAHISMRFSRTVEQWKHDAEVVFTRGYQWITGTEAGDNVKFNALRAVAKKHGYRVGRYKSNWIAVRKDFMKPGSLKFDSWVIVEKEKVWGRGHDTNIIVATFTPRNERIAPRIVVACSHYPLAGKPDSKDPAKRRNLKHTRKVGKVIGRVARNRGKGDALFFYGGDQNIVDKRADTFFGSPLTSCWDETKKYPNTGHGNIDVIASYDGDKRVTCLKTGTRAFTDKDLFLYTDHFLIQARYRVGLMDRKAS